MIKKQVYIAAWVGLGLLLQFLLHAGVEIWMINRLLSDFPRYSLGLSWNEWFLLHHIGTVILVFVGILFGIWQGNLWWKRIYS